MSDPFTAVCSVFHGLPLYLPWMLRHNTDLSTLCMATSLCPDGAILDIAIQAALLPLSGSICAGGLAAPAIAAGVGAAIGLAGGSAAVATGVTGIKVCHHLSCIVQFNGFLS